MLQEDPAKVGLNNYYEKRTKIDSNSKPHVSKNSFRYYINYIAPIIFILIIGGFAVYMNKNSNNATEKSNGQPQAENVAAGNQTKSNTSQEGLSDLTVENANTQAVTKSAITPPTSVPDEKIVTEKTAAQKNIPAVIENKNEVQKKETQPKVSNSNTVATSNNTQPLNRQPASKKVVPVAIPDNTVAKSSNTVNNLPSLQPDTKTTATATNTPEEKPVAEKKAPASIGSYVQMQTVTQSEGNKRLQVRNISDTKLDLVVVDIQYYDANNKFAKGESIYLHNIPAGKNMLVNTPDDKMASRITAKVSLVSSDEKGVYLVGE